MNSEKQIEIIALGSNGEGIGGIDDGTVFVDFCIPGETVLVKNISAKKKVANAKLVKIVKSVNGRVNPKCKVFGSCGGCQLQHMNYEMQTTYKRNLVKSNIKKIAKIDFPVAETVASIRQYNYRNKLQIPVAETRDGIVTGFFGPESHVVVATDACPIHEQWADSLCNIIRTWANEAGVSAYNEMTKQGLLRHVVARNLCDQLLVSLVINGDCIPKIENLTSKLEDTFKKVGLFLNINKTQTNIILGKQDVHVFGIEQINGVFAGLKFKLQPKSFFQVNTEMCEKIYASVRDEFLNDDIDVIIDAYSGIGILSGILAMTGKEVIAIEIVPEAVSDAREMKELNRLSNLNLVLGSVSEVLPKIMEQNSGKRIGMVVDPPRKGLDKSIIDIIVEAKLEKVVYISCDSATLARDISILSKKYLLTKCIPFDMFPQTRHVETLVCLKKKCDIRYQQLSLDDILPDMLLHFDRFQEVKKSWRKQNGEWTLVDTPFIEKWDASKKRHIVNKDFTDTIRSGGFVFGAFDANKLIGFAVVPNTLIGENKQYIQLAHMQVSFKYRYKGIGRALFQSVLYAARTTNAKKIYISAQSSQESQAFYRSMGCVDAEEVIPELFEAEPYDVHMEYVL